MGGAAAWVAELEHTHPAAAHLPHHQPCLPQEPGWFWQVILVPRSAQGRVLPPASHPDLVPIEVWHGFGLGRLLLTRRPAGRREQRKEKGEWSLRDVGEEGASGGHPWDLPAPFFTVPECSSRVRVGVCFWNPGRPVLSRVWSLRSLTGCWPLRRSANPATVGCKSFTCKPL